MQLFEEDTEYTDAINELFKELIVMQLVASAEAYELEITHEVLKRNLDRIASSQSAKRDIITILSTSQINSTWTDVKKMILEEGTRSLTAPSFDSWIKWLCKNYIPAMNIPKPDFLLLTEILATRNLFAHHRGIVNSKYNNRTSDYYQMLNYVPPSVGSVRKISHDYCQQAIKCFNKIIRQIDDQIYTIIR
jgi:hypothetical protein